MQRENVSQNWPTTGAKDGNGGRWEGTHTTSSCDKDWVRAWSRHGKANSDGDALAEIR